MKVHFKEFARKEKKEFIETTIMHVNGPIKKNINNGKNSLI